MVFRTAALVLLSLVGMGGMSGQAFGQIAPGRSGMSTGMPLENVRAFHDLSLFGRCFVRNQRNQALSLIATTPGTPEEDQIVRRLVRRGDPNCLFPGDSVTLSVVYLRGVIAEALLRSDTGLPANYRLPAPTAAEVRNLGDVARCYASGHRTQVQNLLATEPGTAEEVAAVQSLWNDFRVCFPPNTRIRMNATWIRFLLAEALLRLALDAAAPASGN